MHAIVWTMKNALITGSETFGDYITNPTKWLALTARSQVIQDHRIHSLVLPSIVRLPAEADHGEMIVQQALACQADVIISFGMASAVPGFRIERTATNWIENDRYCAPYENKQILRSTEPAHAAVQIDLRRWDIIKMKQEFTEHQLPFDEQISDDPGQYSCNGWIYRTVQALQRHHLTIPYLFVHIPCTEAAIEFIPDFPRNQKVLIKETDLLTGLDILLRSYR